MADYKETTAMGKKYRRCNSIRINNPLAPSTPSVYFDEEDVVLMEGIDPIKVSAGMFGCGFDPSAQIELLDTDTLEPLGPTISEGELYVILFSKYIAAAKARDAQMAAMRAEYEARLAAEAAAAAQQPLPE